MAFSRQPSIHLVFLGLAVAAGVIAPFDEYLVRWANAWRWPPHDRLLLWLEREYPRWQLGIALALGALLYGLRTGRERLAGFVLGVAPLGAALATNPIKAIVGRPRPQLELEGLHQLTVLADGRSFPSGHVSAATAFAAALWWATPPSRWRPLTLLPIPLLAWDRVALGVHHPSDTFAGMVVGLAASP